MQVTTFTDESLVLSYCSLDDVRRVLRSKPQRRVRLSEHVEQAKFTGSIVLNAIEVDAEFASQNKIKITFSSATDFSAVEEDQDTRATNFLGNGSTTATFTASNGIFKIQPSGWSGVAVSGNTVEFKFGSHMSVFDAVEFARDAESRLDSFFLKILVVDPTLHAPGTRLFSVDPDTPEAIRFATSWIAGFLIYNAIFTANQTQPEDRRGRAPTEVDVWKENAMEVVRNFLAAMAAAATSESPRVISDKVFFPHKGVPGTGGVEGVVHNLSRQEEILELDDLVGEFEETVFDQASTA